MKFHKQRLRYPSHPTSAKSSGGRHWSGSRIEGIFFSFFFHRFDLRRACAELCKRKINKIQIQRWDPTFPHIKKICTFKMDDFLLTILPSILVPCDLDFYLHIDILSFLYVCLPTIFAVEDFWTNFSRQHCRPHLSGPGRKDIASSLKLSTVKYHCFSDFETLD